MIVVTGVNGMIGREVLNQLSSVGVQVLSISRNVFDLSEGKNIISFVKERPSAIIHLAAAVPHSLHYPDNEISSDLTRRIDKCVYDAARVWNCRVVYASTCSLYDKSTEEVKSEDSSICPRLDSAYLKAKIEGEHIFSQLDSYALMRLPAPIGPGLPKTVVAKFFFDLACKGMSVKLWGSGLREQNYVDVSDIANAMIKAAYSNAKGPFNIAADAPTTMKMLADSIVNIIGRGKVEFVDKPDPLEYERARYSSGRASLLLDWHPMISLEESIHSMLKSA
jgi:UDP-glucose 4-epimerase